MKSHVRIRSHASFSLFHCQISFPWKQLKHFYNFQKSFYACDLCFIFRGPMRFQQVNVHTLVWLQSLSQCDAKSEAKIARVNETFTASSLRHATSSKFHFPIFFNFLLLRQDCSKCHTKGKVNCQTCEGHGQIRCFIQLSITWKVKWFFRLLLKCKILFHLLPFRSQLFWRLWECKIERSFLVKRLRLF